MTFTRATLVALVFIGPHVAEARLGSGVNVGAADLTESTFEAFVQTNDKVLVDFYNPSDPIWKEGKNEFETAIRNLRNLGSKVPFAKVDVSKEPALATKFVPDGKYPQLMWFLHGEATQYHRALRTSKAISDFVIALDREAMVPVKTEEEARDFVPAVFAHVAKNSPTWKILEVVAQKHMDTVAFTFLDGSGNDISWLAGTDPVKYDGVVDVPSLEKWVKLKLLKSEAIPEDPASLEDEGSKVVVGRNFEEIVLQKDKDVMLQVYAPWCGFCKKFAPIWNSFARQVADVPHLVVAKMDGSRNSSPLPEDFSWDAYPKVFLVQAGATKPVYFTGDRTVENLVDFVSKHGSKPVSVKVDSRSGSTESILDL
jgi:protein disulfide-isomerase-like protein